MGWVFIKAQGTKSCSLLWSGWLLSQSTATHNGFIQILITNILIRDRYIRLQFNKPNFKLTCKYIHIICMYISDIQIQSTMSECITNKEGNGHKKRSNNMPRTWSILPLHVFFYAFPAHAVVVTLLGTP